MGTIEKNSEAIIMRNEEKGAEKENQRQKGRRKRKTKKKKGRYCEK